MISQCRLRRCVGKKRLAVSVREGPCDLVSFLVPVGCEVRREREEEEADSSSSSSSSSSSIDKVSSIVADSS